MNFIIFLITCLLFFAPDSQAVEICCPTLFKNYFCGEEPKIKFNYFGYVKWAGFFDSRQILGRREDYVFFWPLKKVPDVRGRDINARPHFNMLSIESFLALKLKSKNIYDSGFDANAVLGLDFAGIREELLSDLGFYINQFGIRFVFGRLVNKPLGVSFLFGLIQHPLFDIYPHTLDYSLGLPINNRASNPQVRFSKKVGSFEFMAVAVSQGFFSSIGPIGLSSTYLRNAILPELFAQIKYSFAKNTFGVMGDFKRLVPRLATNKNIKVHESINSGVFGTFLTISHKTFRFRTKTLFVQNTGGDQGMLSGFAVKTVDPITDARTYANIAAVASWFDTSYYFKKSKIEIGLFIGGTKNFGANRRLFINPATLAPIAFEIDPTVNFVFRFSPRILYKNKQLRIGFEFEDTCAGFGTVNACAKVNQNQVQHDIRLFSTIFYIF